MLKKMTEITVTVNSVVIGLPYKPPCVTTTDRVVKGNKLSISQLVAHILQSL